MENRRTAVRHTSGVRASMRPRHCCRGERAPPRITSFWPTASFNEATALLPWRTQRIGQGTPRGSGASMRPRHCCRGEQSSWTISIRNIFASMRPRHCCRGEPVLALHLVGLHLASMRPRHCCRGEPTPTTLAKASRLCFNEATALLPWRTFGTAGVNTDTQVLQ